ncbi:hypothetical protein AB4563_25000 [Vibrio splendidus]
MEQSKYLEVLAEDTLSIFDTVSEQATKKLPSNGDTMSNDALAYSNS